MSKPKEQKHFRFAVRGPDVSPDTLRAGDLAHLLLALEKALLDSTRQQYPEIDAKNLRISLLQVTEGSGVMELVAPSEVIETASTDSKLLANDRIDEIAAEARAGYRQLSNQLSQRGWSGGYEDSAELGIESSNVLGKVDIPLVKRAVRARGSTVLYGRVIRVGGASKPKADVAPLSGGKAVPVSISIDQAKKLARKLYSVVAIKGDAYWDETWSHIERMEAMAILPYREQVSVSDAYEKLAQSAGRVWEEVDADEYVRGVRGEDDQ